MSDEETRANPPGIDKETVKEALHEILNDIPAFQTLLRHEKGKTKAGTGKEAPGPSKSLTAEEKGSDPSTEEEGHLGDLPSPVELEGLKTTKKIDNQFTAGEPIFSRDSSPHTGFGDRPIKGRSLGGPSLTPDSGKTGGINLAKRVH